MSEHSSSPRPHSDLEASHEANIAFRQGKWLNWALNGRDKPTPEEEVLLGGDYDDRALNDVGLDGTVLAQSKQLFDTDESGDSLGRFFAGEKPTASDELRGELHRRHEFHSSPVVREKARLLSNEPIYVDEDPANVLLCFNGRSLTDADGKPIKQQPDSWGADLSFIVPEGKRLVIDNIPKGSKYDSVPYTQDKPLVRAQVQVYHNSEGYLVADKVIGGEIRKKHTVALKPTEDPLAVTVDMDAPEERAMDSLWAANDRKTEWVDPLDPSRKHVGLIRTTSEWALPGSSYDNLEISVDAPDDALNTVEVGLERSNYLPDSYGPIIFRMVEDTGRTIAHDIYQ